MQTSRFLSAPHWTLVSDEFALAKAATFLSAGEGPIAVDVERASGFRYHQRAYLIQIFRRGSGTFLIDPVAIPRFDELYSVIKDEEWILHAAGADISSLRELGLNPKNLYDTELASRLLNLDRVGLGFVSEALLDIKLEKAYSRADWSIRPLPDPWLQYAALDVLVLPDLRDATHDSLKEQGKLEYAKQEFQALLNLKPKPPLEEPWRKLSGFGRLKDPRSRSVAKELWLSRDIFASEQDIAPGRVIPDASILIAAEKLPRSAGELAKNKDFKGPHSRRELERWWRAILKGKNNPLQYEPRSRVVDAMPQSVKSWEKKSPEAYARILKAREYLEAAADSYNIPSENLLAPAVLKQICWNPPEMLDIKAIKQKLFDLGAREWQTELTTQLIADSFVDVE